MERAIASDAELIDASRRGERDAFGALVERYANMVVAVSYAGTRDRTLGEDIAQDTFVAAWRDLGRLRDGAAVRPWLCGIARNLARKARRRHGREVAAPEPDAVSDRTPLDVLREGQAERLVAAALERVPDVYREALVLFYYEQRSTKDVAEALGIREDAVHQRLSRGRKHLAAGLEDSVERVLEGRRSRRNLAAAVLAALPVTLAMAPSHAEAATKGLSMWKIGLAGIAATTVAVGTVVAWPHHDGKTVERTAPATATARASSPLAAIAPGAAPAPTLLPAPAAGSASGPEGSAGSGGAVDCTAVARHMLDLAMLEAPTPANMTMDDNDWTARMLRTQFEGVCRDAAWSQGTMSCVLAADDMWNAMMCKGANALPPLPAPAPATADASCAAVAAHAFALMSASLAASVPQDQRAAIDAQRAPATAMFETECTRQAWTEAQRRCAIAATTPFQLGACMQSPTPPRVTPAPPGTEASCAAIGKHVGSLLAQPVSEDLLPGVPEDVRKTLATASPDIAAQVETACTNGSWPDSLRRCLLGTQRPLDFAGCQQP